MYEAEVKKFATYVNSKVDILGDRIPESVEQATLEFVFGVAVKVIPEMAYGFPVRALAVQFAMSFINDPAVVGERFAAFLHEESK